MRVLIVTMLLFASAASAEEIWECYKLGETGDGPSIRITVDENHRAEVEILRQKMLGIRQYDGLAMVIKFKPLPWEYDLSLETGKSAVEENDPKNLDYEANGHAKLYEDQEKSATILAAVCKDRTT